MKNPTWKLAPLIAAGMLSVPGSVTAQQDPTAAGGGKKPFVLVVIDSSASMEWTDDGDDTFPVFGRDSNGDATSFNVPVGYGYEVRDEYLLRDDDEYFLDVDPGDPSSGPDAFGPCFIWEPTPTGEGDEEEACKKYLRPAWRPTTPATWTIAQPNNKWQEQFENRTTVSNRLDYMRGSGVLPSLFEGVRLRSAHQPRMVTVKEVMTGSMIMFPNDATNFDVENYAASTFGPGCWLVPRMRDASAIDSRDSSICLADDRSELGKFSEYPDFIQPYPHYQEAYDRQWRNGVMDRLGSTVIFGFAAFDSFRDDLDGKDTDGNGTIDAPNWEGKMNDKIDGSSPLGYANAFRTGLDEGSGDCNGTGKNCYDLGIYRVVAPTRLDIPATYMPQVSAFTQIALNDTGYLTREGGKEYDLDPKADASQDNSFLGATFTDGFDRYIKKHKLGKTPIARATPLAAVMHDAYQYFAYGQDGNNPFSPAGGRPNDPFAECRPKHVVLMTDGKPEPERGDPATLSAAFGYDEDRYIYDTVENEIAALVNDPDDIVYPTDNTLNAQYGVKVHVVGLNIGDSGDPTSIEKLAKMAMEGQTCAEVYMTENDNTWMPTTAGGTCVPGSGCLVDQSAHTAGYQYTRPGEDAAEDCQFAPALILDNNDPEILQRALSRLFSEVLASSGLASRTRAVVANRLDDLSIPSGGQYRVFSGVRIGGSDWWKGVLNRLTLFCDATVPPSPQLSFDEEIGTQVNIVASATQDSRRVFTSVPTNQIWDYGNRDPANVSSFAPNSTFPMLWDLAAVDNTANDEFQDTYLPISTATDVLGKRVPFRNTALKEAYDNAANESHLDHLNSFSEDEVREIVNTFRGRIASRVPVSRDGAIDDERTLGGILNSNPVIVGPPNLDIPIGSYREFRAKHADRPTMLYVASMEGYLHAIHTGRLTDRIPVRALTDEDTFPSATDISNVGEASEQREAWAFMPFMLHRELSSNKLAQPYLFDGTPVVKDVRLCNAEPGVNTSYACTSVCNPGTCGRFPQAEQWRTVLVQGRGLAGAGYFALDITRPGGFAADNTAANNLVNPDPLALWEFDANWEEAQVRYLLNQDSERVAATGVSVPGSYLSDCGADDDDEDEFWRTSMLGFSISEPEIGTVLVGASGSGTIQRSVAVFGGGLPLADLTGCAAAANGMAIYVVDLQTGSILRRFTSYVDDSGNEQFFGNTPVPSELDDPGPGYFTGTPALFDNGTGAVASRGFIGDSRGRMWRMDFLSPDPAEWEVTLFFDPYDNTQIATIHGTDLGLNPDVPFGPAAFKPGVALTTDRKVTVVYGLGETGDTVSSGQVQAIITLVEDIANRKGVPVWAEVFPEGEKLTGSPTIFNRTVYFPTYQLPVEDQCLPGAAKIWGLQLFDPDDTNLAPMGVFQNNSTLTSGLLDKVVLDANDADGIKWWGPSEPTLIRGVTVTLGPQCAADGIGDDNATIRPGAAQKPQLVVQTSGDIDIDGSLKNTDDSSSTRPQNEVDRLIVDIDPARTQTIPLSWSLISN